MSKISEMTRESWIESTFPEWGTWLVEDIENEVVAPENVAMWWLGCTGVWFKTPADTNISIDLWCGNGKRTHGDGKMKVGHQMANMCGARAMQPNLRNVPFVIDPFAFKKVDAVLATHYHQDHMSAEWAAHVIQSGMTTVDENGKEIFHTAGYEKYWISRVGMETVWLRKERVKEVVSVQETFAAMEFLEKPERGIVSAEISIRMKMTDESCRWTRVGYEIMMPDNGTDKKVVVTFTDEEKEKQSEAEYAEVIRERDNLILTISGGIAIYEITDKIRTVYITEETAALAGYTKKELMEIIGENALALCHPDDIKTTQNYFKTRRQQVRVMSYEYRIKNKNGMYQWVSVRARFVQQKNSILLYTIMTDIDQIKKAEEDARMQKKMLELALQQSDFRFWDYDIKTHRLYRSWAVTQQVGFGEYEENVPEGFVELGLIHPDDCEAYLEFYHNVQQGKNQRLTFRAIHQNGEWGWMDIAYRVFFNEQGEPVRAIGVGGDVSKQREKEQKYLKDFELFRDVSIYAIQRVFLDVFLVDIPTDSIRLVLAQGGYMNMKEIQGYDKILNQKLCRYVRDKEDAVKKLSIAQIKKNIALTKDHKLEYTFELRNEKGRKCWYKYYISYFHENTEKLLALVKDVTNTTRLEDEKRLELEAALVQAKKANDA